MIDLLKRGWTKTGHLAGVAAMILGAAGCGGGGSGSGPATVSSVAPIIQPSVKVLPSDGTVQVVSQTDQSITLSGAVPSLSPGSVMVSGAGEGMLRKVVSVASGGGNTIVQTSDAMLTDVFQQADILLDKQINASDIQEITPLEDGVSVGNGTSAAAKSSKSFRRDASTAAFTLNLANVKLPGGSTVNGSAAFALGLDFDIKVRDSAIQNIRFVPEVQTKLNLTAALGVADDADIKKISLARVKMRPILVLVGPVPVIFTPTLEVTAVHKVNGGFRYEFVARNEKAVKAGIVYSRGSGWNTVKDVSGNDNAEAPQPTFKASVEATYGIEEKLSVKVYTIAGPFLSLSNPNFKIKTSYLRNATPKGIETTIDGGMVGTAGFEAQLIGEPLKFSSSIEASTQVFRRFWPDDEPTPTPTQPATPTPTPTPTQPTAPITTGLAGRYVGTWHGTTFRSTPEYDARATVVITTSGNRMRINLDVDQVPTSIGNGFGYAFDGTVDGNSFSTDPYGHRIRITGSVSGNTLTGTVYGMGETTRSADRVVGTFTVTKQ